ncbi:hypothetical protein LNO16_27970 [Klebsiella quasipneumoniae subsp. quasipneumoniae]|uniref:hypothetical protein n=2 Tax=Klebsiella pneumoniae complex TaxID=3390273 RepID=UPI00217DE76C|nr:hypothetical protein [Klebsiella quasipneumoniae]MCS5752693.1 hypothetical protein [Klebsiella quasipneumoniae subsp. quasipneumoniae]
MKSISIMSGVLSSDSGAPLFSDAFPELVNPDNRKFVDYFKGGTGGGIAGRILPGTDKVWAGNYVNVHDGYAQGGASATDLISGRAVVNIGEEAVNGEWGVCVNVANLTDNVAGGLVFRDSTESGGIGFAATISPVSQVVALRRRNGSSYSTLLTVPAVIPVGDFNLRVVASGSSIKVYTEKGLVINYTTTDLGAGFNRAGIICYGSLKVTDFMGG